MEPPLAAVALLAVAARRCSRARPAPSPRRHAAADPAVRCRARCRRSWRGSTASRSASSQILPLAKAELDRVSVADRDRRKPEVAPPRAARSTWTGSCSCRRRSPAACRPTPARWTGRTTRCGASTPTRRPGRSSWPGRAWTRSPSGRSCGRSTRWPPSSSRRRQASPAGGSRGRVEAALLARLRAKARIELLL